MLEDYKKEIKAKIKLKKISKLCLIVAMELEDQLQPNLFKDLGIELIELYSDIDGNFPNHHPDPRNPINLKDLINKVVKLMLI